MRRVARYTAKLSEDKHTLPGANKIFRYADHDQLARSTECPSCPPGAEPAEALLRPVMLGGRLVEPLPSTEDARRTARERLAALPAHATACSRAKARGRGIESRARMSVRARAQRSRS
jgi:hypothetical protein